MIDDTLKNVMFEKYTLILKHEYEISEHGKISRIKADDPLCITCTTEFTGRKSPPVYIDEMMDRMRHALLEHMTEE